MKIADWLHKGLFFIQFGGQGAAYFPELSKYYQEEELKDYFQLALPAISNELQKKNIQASGLFDQGIDLERWLLEPDTAPDEKYLALAQFSFPLIGMAQLAGLFLLFNRGFNPEEIERRSQGSTGHSQGVVSAIFTGLDLKAETMLELVPNFIKYLFYMGFTAQLAYHELKSANLDTNPEDADLPTVSPMVAVVGPTAEELEKLLSDFNQGRNDEDKVYLSLLNTPNTNVISAQEKSHRAFYSQIKEHIQEKKWRFIPVLAAAPFHSPLLQKGVEYMEKAMRTEFSFPYKGSDLKTPVYSFADGRNLQEDGDLAITIYREIIIDTLQWKLAVSEHINKPDLDYVLDFGLGRVSSRLSSSFLIDQDKGAAIYSFSNPKDLNKLYSA